MENSELRQDIVTGDWVVVATARAKRPHDFVSASPKSFNETSPCPFDDIRENVIQKFPNDADPFVTVIKNKYPAFAEGQCKVPRAEGIYVAMDGAGNHEVVVTKDHIRPIPDFSDAEVGVLMESYRARFQALKDGACTDYVLIFHNHGPESGATIAHPHSQIMGLPVIPPDVERSLKGSRGYLEKNGRCVYCDVIAHELSHKSRVVFENEHAIAICPFASKMAFEMRIFPKRHTDFLATTTEEMLGVGQALRDALRRIRTGLKDPSYNFFIHAAPTISEGSYEWYHWHIEILPKTAVWAGFEIGTGMEILTIAPETAAEFLQSVSQNS